MTVAAVEQTPEWQAALEELIDWTNPVVRRAATRVKRAYQLIEFADLVAEANLLIISKPAPFWDYYVCDNERPVYKAAQRVMWAYARREMNTRYPDAVFYSTASIEELLPHLGDYRTWSDDQLNDGTPRAKQPLAHRGTKLAMIVDVSRAYDQLSEYDQVIISAYAATPGATGQEIAKRLHMDDNAYRRDKSRAISRMEAFLNNFRNA